MLMLPRTQGEPVSEREKGMEQKQSWGGRWLPGFSESRSWSHLFPKAQMHRGT